MLYVVLLHTPPRCSVEINVFELGGESFLEGLDFYHDTMDSSAFVFMLVMKI